MGKRRVHCRAADSQTHCQLAFGGEATRTQGAVFDEGVNVVDSLAHDGSEWRGFHGSSLLNAGQ